MNTLTDGDRGTRRALEHLNSVLTSNETLEAWAIQRRLFALKRRRLVIAATSGRFLALTRGVFGGFTLADIRWQDLKEVKIDVGILGACLTLTAFASPDLASASAQTSTFVYDGLRKDQAEALYRIAQGHDQAWREKRRVRDLEEMRARAGGIQVGNLAGGAPDAATGDATQRLQKAKSMLDAGLISDSEYESLKAKIINQV
jgi:Short C-terminal domain